MDTLNQYRDIIEKVLTNYAKIPNSNSELEDRVVFDHERDQYLWLCYGWDNKRHEHGVIAHLEIVNGKIWIQENNTEEGIATDLEAAGIPKNQIVLGFRHPDLRPYTEYAVA
ncbi:MAG: XisI protein [Acidobacteriota bacterium]